MSAATPRHALPDALRALALIGVLAVNAAGYAVAPSGPLMGHAVPRDSAIAWVVQGLQAALLQGKAYPLLAMLFGMGLVWATGGGADSADTRSTSQRQRLRRLLVLGVLHGSLLYFGDILTIYAVCGMLVLGQVRKPWTSLRRTLRTAWGWAVLASMGMMLLAGYAAGAARPSAGDEIGLGQISTAWAFWSTNAAAYAVAQTVGLLTILPLVRALLLTGIAAARLRWLTHRRWFRQRQWLVRYAFWPLLVLQLAYGAATVMFSNAERDGLALVETAGPFIGVPMSMCLAALAAQQWAAGKRCWALRLAPLGQRTLSLYLSHSLWCVLLFSGVGLSWEPSSLMLFALTLLLWLVAWQLALRSRRRWPAEAWMGRRAPGRSQAESPAAPTRLAASWTGRAPGPSRAGLIPKCAARRVVQ